MAAYVKNLRLRTKPREEFNKHRNLELLNLPPSTKGEISEFLGKFKTQKITQNESLDKATVTLVDGSQVEEAVESLNNKMFKDSTVMVKAGYNPQLLCVSHFPLSYTDEDFLKLCQNHGTVAWSFVMRSEDTGDSKGYGFVEFATDLEQAKTIKADIDWSPLEGQTLHADFLDEAFQAYEHLHSRCLLITNMPENFIDVSKLRDMFGCVTSPVYCQIIAKDEKSLGYGIIEFRTAEDAEQTWLKLRDEKIEDADVTMTFCIPGKPAVMINNRIMWKFGDKFQKSSLLPDPVTAKPVIEGNPIVISLTKLNPKLMGEFTTVLGELQQAYVSQMMSPINKPGLLGPAPSLPLSPMMNPNMQLGLLVMMAIYIQTAKKEKFAGVLAKQLNTLSEQEGNTEVSGPKPSILGDPMTGQANVILTSLKQQLNQVPLTGEDSKELEEPAEMEEKIKFIVKKFVANGRYLNLSLLSNLGQLLVTMKQVSGGGAMDLLGRTPGPGLLSTPGTGIKGPSLLGPVPGSSLLGGVPQPLIGNNENKGNSLLGNAPNAMGKPQPLLGMGPATGRGGAGSMGAVPGGGGGQSASSGANNVSIMQAMGLNVGSNSSSSMSNMGHSLLNQISQGLVHQIGQNIMYQMAMESGQSGGLGGGRGLLGDIPNGGTNSNNTGGAGGTAGNQRVKNNKNSLLGEAPTSMKGAQQSSLDQGSWKGAENRWGSGANYESGYGNKSSLGGGYNDYGYGDSYGQQDMSSGGFGGGYGSYGDSDFYNYQQQYGFGGQTDNYQTDSGYNQYTSSGFSGMGSSGLGAGGTGSGSGGGFGMSGGYSGNQASGVNFQDGLAYGRGSSGGGLGQDNGKYGGEGYGVGMSSGGYGYGGRDDLGNSNYDSFGSVGGYGSGMGDGMGGSSSGLSRGGIGGGGNGLMGSMPGDGGMGSTGSYSTSGTSGMGGMGGGTGSMGGMGGGSGSMGGMVGGSGSMGGMGGGSGSMGGMGSGSGSGMGLLGSGVSGSMGMMGSNGGGSYGVSGSGSYGGSGGGSYGGTGGSYGGTGGGSYGGGMSPIMSGSSKMGMGDGLGGMSARDQGSMSSYYQSSSAVGSGGSSSVSGLLPSPSKYLTPAGQKRSHSQLLPKPEASPDGADFIGQHSQGLGGHYFDSSYGKRSRLF